MPRRWIDITVALTPEAPVWPGDPRPRIERIAALARGDAYNLSAMSVCLHTATHVDAPLHYLEGGAGVESMPLDAMTGPARVIALRGGDLSRHRIRRGERILFKTAQHGALTRAAAEHLAARGVRMVGIDALSIGPADEEGDDVHRILLGAGVWILEGIDLSSVKPGRYDLVALPLKIPGSDGAPARAMVRKRGA